MTQIVGLEVRPIPSLTMQLSPGTKIKLRATHTPMRRGTALLSLDCFMVLEGSVERLVGCTATQPAPAPALPDKPREGPLSDRTGSVMNNQSPRMHPPQQRPEQQHQQQQRQQQEQQGFADKESHRQLITSAECSSTLTSTPPIPTPPIPSTVSHIAPSSSGRGNHSLLPSSVYGGDKYPPSHMQSVSMPSSATNFNMKQSQPATSSASHISPTASSIPLNHLQLQQQQQQQQQQGRALDGVLDLCSPGTPQSLSPRALLSSIVAMKEEMEVDDYVNGLGRERDSGIISYATVTSDPAPPMKSSPIFSSPVSDNPALPTVPSNQRPLIRLSMDEIAVMLSNTSESDTVTGSGILPDGDFVVQGTAVNIRRFKATATEGYVVLLSMEEEDEGGGEVGESHPHARAVVPASVCDDLCARYLQASSAEYLSQLKAAGKEESKTIKTNFSLKFRDFKGSFRARLLRPRDNKVNTGTEATPSKSSSSGTANSQGEGMSLLLVDFYDPG